VDHRVFPYLYRFTAKATGPNAIEYKIGQIFAEIKNKITSSYNLREIIDQIDAPAVPRATVWEVARVFQK